jgi:hypothetical protein
MDDFLATLPTDVPWVVSNDTVKSAANFFERIDSVLDLGTGGAVIYTKSARPIDGPILYQLLLRCKYFWTDFTREEFWRGVAAPLFYPYQVDYDFICHKFGFSKTYHLHMGRERVKLVSLLYRDIFLG